MPTYPYSAFICMGSNADTAENYLQNAAQCMANYSDCRLVSFSKIYLTEPQDDNDQAWFHNQVLRMDFKQHPNFSDAIKLLDFLQKTENTLGRVRNPARRFGPRTIDLDILLAGELVCNDPRLILPHPRLFQRAFALLPLQDVAPDLVFPNGILICNVLNTLIYKLDENKIFQ